MARRTPLPRVTLLILLGVAAGPVGFDVLPPDRERWFPVAATVALVMIGFLLGGELSGSTLREFGGRIFVLAGIEASTTAGVVAAGLALTGQPASLVLPLAGIAAATAPAATLAVIRETSGDRRRESEFVRVLKGVVAVDDVLGIVIFSLLAVTASILAGAGGEMGLLWTATRELGGALLLGVALGVPTAYLSGRIRSGEALLEEALGAVLVCAGLALWIEASPILSALVLGLVVGALARHHERPFHEIERIEWPFLVLFFILSGATLEVDAVLGIGVTGAAYVALRAAGKVVGSWTGGLVVGLEPSSRRWLGPALMPQAGVALGLALAARVRFPETGERILTLIVVSTVVFELSGPVLTRLALSRARR